MNHPIPPATTTPAREPRRPLSVAAALAVASAAMLSIGAAQAHGPQDHARAAGPVTKEQMAWGIAGDAAAATRTLHVDMDDRMRFTPDRLRVREGETVRIAVRNLGQVKHEFVLGTEAVLREHAEMMRRFPDMEHDEPWMAHVDPGQTGTLVWTFNRAGRFDFGCLLPGHYEAGMVGRVEVTPRGEPQ